MRKLYDLVIDWLKFGYPVYIQFVGSVILTIWGLNIAKFYWLLPIGMVTTILGIHLQVIGEIRKIKETEGNISRIKTQIITTYNKFRQSIELLREYRIESFSIDPGPPRIERPFSRLPSLPTSLQQHDSE